MDVQPVPSGPLRDGPLPRRPATLTLDLLLGGFGVGHHSGHVHAVPVQVLQEDVGVPSGERAGLGENRQRVLMGLTRTYPEHRG